MFVKIKKKFLLLWIFSLLWFLGSALWIEEKSISWNWMISDISDRDEKLLLDGGFLKDSGKLQKMNDQLFLADSGFFHLQVLDLVEGNWPSNNQEAVISVTQNMQTGDWIETAQGNYQISGLFYSTDPDWKEAVLLLGSPESAAGGCDLYLRLPSMMESAMIELPLSKPAFYHSGWHNDGNRIISTLFLILSSSVFIDWILLMQRKDVYLQAKRALLFSIPLSSMRHQWRKKMLAVTAWSVPVLLLFWLIERNVIIWIWLVEGLFLIFCISATPFKAENPYGDFTHRNSVSRQALKSSVIKKRSLLFPPLKRWLKKNGIQIWFCETVKILLCFFISRFTYEILTFYPQNPQRSSILLFYIAQMLLVLGVITWYLANKEHSSWKNCTEIIRNLQLSTKKERDIFIQVLSVKTFIQVLMIVIANILILLIMGWTTSTLFMVVQLNIVLLFINLLETEFLLVGKG